MCRFVLTMNKLKINGNRRLRNFFRKRTSVLEMRCTIQLRMTSPQKILTSSKLAVRLDQALHRRTRITFEMRSHWLL